MSMKAQSRFIKLPGERVNMAQAEAGLPCPDCYTANYWMDREEIQSVMELRNDATGEMAYSTIYCRNGDTFHCTLPATEVMNILNEYDRQATLYQLS